MSRKRLGLLSVLAFVTRHPLNASAKVDALARLVRWQLATRLLPFPVAVPFVNDLRLLAERGMTGATGNFYCGLHEPEDMAFLLHFLRPGDVFYDIGANVGSYSLLAAAAGVSEVHAFEPSCETSEVIRRNIGLNGLVETIHLHRVALGTRSGEVRFTRGRDTTNHVVADGEGISDAEVVSQRPLDDFYACGRPSFLKLDVEGFEISVLDGAKNALADPSLMGLLVEDDGYTKRYGETRRAPGVLAEHGFLPFVYDPWKRRLEPRTQGMRGTNKLFLRDPEAAMERTSSAPVFKLVNGTI